MKARIEAIFKEALAGELADLALEILPQEKEEFGHYTTPVAMRLAKLAELDPRSVAENIKDKIEAAAPAGFFARVEVAGPGFINMWLADDAVRAEFAAVAKEAAHDRYGASDAGKGKKVIVEYSQPNIAKELHTGHLRNTILGDALANLEEAQGYDVVRWNYMGDWGTQFGKMIAAWKRWGKEIEAAGGLGDRPIEKLQELYVRFNAEAKADPEMEKEGAAEFRKLEQGDKENRKLWEWFKKESLREIQSIYDLLGVKFDTYISESFFEDRMEPTVQELLDKGVAKVSEGAVIVPLDDAGLPPGLIRKSDGASLYLTRDIAALEYRLREHKPAKLLYVVGNEQALHFAQLLATAAKLGVLPPGTQVVHVKYGLLLGESGKKMSTREGTSVSVKGLIEKAIALARGIMDEKNPDLPQADKERVARAVGVGALKYFMLHEGRTSDIVFDWKKMLDFTGDSGPYLQYTNARLRRVLAKAAAEADAKPASPSAAATAHLAGEHELRLMRKLFQFPDQVARSAEELITNNLTEYLFQLTNLANRFYEAEQIISDGDHERRAARLLLAETAARVIARGLKLLGIEAPEAI